MLNSCSDSNKNDNLTLTHNLQNFTITMEDDKIKANPKTEIYIDADNDTSTGFNADGIGAEYRVINTTLTSYDKDTKRWIKATDDGITKHISKDKIITTLPRWRIHSRRTISVMGFTKDSNDNISNTFGPVRYKVEASNDEITLSFNDPDFYLFTIHSKEIGENPTLDDGILRGGRARSITCGLDLDNDNSTGLSQYDIGTEVSIGTWDGGEFLRWDQTNNRWIKEENIEILLGENSLTFKIARDRIRSTSEDGAINTSAVFNNMVNNRPSHYRWANRYEFDLN
jgi:hypothetical protein